MQYKIKYIERKTDGLRGVGRIARVSFSKTGKTIYYAGKTLSSLAGYALKANYFDADTFEEYWISNPRKDGNDSLFAMTITIDEDVRMEYWSDIRKLPNNSELAEYKSAGKTKQEREKIEKSGGCPIDC